MAWRFLRAYERRQRPSLDDSMQACLAQVEESILRIDSELTALGEEQRFLTRLLGDRQDVSRDQRPNER